MYFNLAKFMSKPGFEGKQRVVNNGDWLEAPLLLLAFLVAVCVKQAHKLDLFPATQVCRKLEVFP